MIKKIVAFVSVLLVLTACSVNQNNESDKLHAIFADYWEFTLQQYPLFATSQGDERFNDRLTDYSPAAIETRIAKELEILQELQQIDDTQLNEHDKINLEVFKRLRENDAAESRFKAYLLPITSRSGFHVSFPQIPDRVPFKTAKDYRDYVARLNAFGSYTDQHIELLRRGLKEAISLAHVVIEGVEKSLEPHIVADAQASLLFVPFKNFPNRIPESEQEQLRQQGSNAIIDIVVPAYRRFLKFMLDEYIPETRKTIAASDLPDGKNFYEHRVRLYTSLNKSPKEVHETGIAEVNRIKKEMEQVIKDVGFQGEFKEFVHFLRTDRRFYVNEPDQLMKEVAYALKKMDGELPRLFKTLPRMSYGIKPIPDFIAPKTTTAYYSRPAGDGTRAGFYYVNTYDLSSRPLYEIEALSLHEAVPGHHLQIARQQELENLPLFRRFAGFTAFVEGWALYAERLGLECGFYEDPYSNFGRLTYEMWRACRLVVDTGIHYFGWSRQRAIDFMADHTALTLLNITNEVDRYIAWPGQALAYKTGELKIRELRKRAEQKLGTAFDIRDFHDRLLENGALPLDLLEQQINIWIGEESTR